MGAMRLQTKEGACSGLTCQPIAGIFRAIGLLTEFQILVGLLMIDFLQITIYLELF